MNKLGKFLQNTAEQIVSTLIIMLGIYCLVKGIISLWTDPPGLWAFFGPVALGFLLGVIRFFNDPENTET
jgi:hypothetical protein